MTDTATDASTLDRAQGWRRLDKRMLLVHPVNETVKFLPVLIGVFVLGRSNDSGPPWHLLTVAIPVLWGITQFFTTRYRITGTQIELHRGLLSKRVLTTRLDKVRTVELTSTPIHRVLGLAKVRIGTGSAAKSHEDTLELDSLAVAGARSLRVALIHRTTTDAPGQTTSETVQPDDVLLAFDPRWCRYAPMTTSGLVIVSAGIGFLAQYAQSAINNFDGSRLGGVRTLPLILTLPAGLLGLATLTSLVAIAGYLISNWDFRLSADPGRRSFHVRRGLLTTKETTLERARVRGLEVREPLGLRLVGAARLSAIVTGVGRKEGGVSPLAPAAPRDLIDVLGSGLLDDPTALTARLTGHGSRARQRRFTRALATSVPPALGLLLLVGYAGWWPWLIVIGLALPLGAIFVAHDRAARLGHLLTEMYLVVRSATFRGRRDIIERDGIIGWNLTQSFFQRRIGLVNLTATTSAGKQGYTAYDIPEPMAVSLADSAVPDLIAQFR